MTTTSSGADSHHRLRKYNIIDCTTISCATPCPSLDDEHKLAQPTTGSGMPVLAKGTIGSYTQKLCWRRQEIFEKSNATRSATLNFIYTSSTSQAGTTFPFRAPFSFILSWSFDDRGSAADTGQQPAAGDPRAAAHLRQPRGTGCSYCGALAVRRSKCLESSSIARSRAQRSPKSAQKRCRRRENHQSKLL